MPTYDYLCDSCGHAFEIVQSFKDDPIVECPNCGGNVRRVIAATAIIFKGSGWYATDSKRPTAGLSATKPGETKAAEGAAESAPAGADAKPGKGAADEAKAAASTGGATTGSA